MKSDADHAPLGRPRIAYNVAGSRDDKCTTCTSWIRHYRNATGTLRTTCAVIGCQRAAIDGAHVRIAGQRRSEWYILPTCETCNRSRDTKTPMTIDRRALPVPAERLSTCRAPVVLPPTRNTHYLVTRKLWTRRVPPCGCLDWTEHYALGAGLDPGSPRLRRTCMMRGCRAPHGRGAVVLPVDGRVSPKPWVVLVCGEHYEALGRTSLFLGADGYMLPAEPLETCRNA